MSATVKATIKITDTSKIPFDMDEMTVETAQTRTGSGFTRTDYVRLNIRGTTIEVPAAELIVAVQAVVKGTTF